MTNSITIKGWALNDQPINKLYNKGSKYLSDAELIAILLQHGTAEQNAVDLARNLLSNCNNNLQKLARMICCR